MKRNLLYVILSLSYILNAQNYNWDSANFMNPNDGPSLLCLMDITVNDEKVVLGYFKNELTIGSETITSTKPVGVYLAKFDSNNSLLWVNKIAEGEEYTSSFIPIFGAIPTIKVDALSNIYVGISYRDSVLIDGEYFVANDSVPSYSTGEVLKYNSEGNLQSHLRFGGSCNKNIGYGRVFPDSLANTYLLVGYGNDVWNTTSTCDCIVSSDTLIADTGDRKTFLAKFSNSGALIWLKSLSAYTMRMTQVESSLYVCGVSQYAQDIPFDSFILDYPSFYDFGGFIAKFDTSGVFHWAKYFGVNEWDSHLQILDVKAVDENNIVLVGRSFTQSVPNRVYFQDAPTLIGNVNGTDDAFIVNYDSLGNVKWHDITAGDSGEWFFNSVSDSDKNVFVSGTFSGTLELDTDTLVSTGSDDVFIVAYDSLGNQLWADNAGGTGIDHSRDLIIDSSENLYLLGSTTSDPIEFGEVAYNPLGSFANVFIAKLAPNDVGIEEFLDQDIHIEIYPNPNSGIFSIVSEEKVEQIEIYNLQGEKVFEKHFSTPVKREELESSLNTGVYVLLIKTEAGNYTAQKMMVGK